MLRKIQQDEIGQFYEELYLPYIKALRFFGGGEGMTENVLRYNLCNTPMEAYVMELDGEQVGFLMTEEVVPPDIYRPMLFLAEFSVKQKYRRRGLGTRAFSELLEELDTPLFFTVFYENEIASSFWRRQIALNELVPVKPDKGQLRFSEGQTLYVFEKAK